MVTFGDVREWSPEPLDETAGLLAARRADLRGAAGALEGGARARGWHGTAADGAGLVHRELIDRMGRFSEGVASVHRAVGLAAREVRELQRSVWQLEDRAAVQQFSITDDGRLIDRAWSLLPHSAGGRMSARAELEASIGQVLRRAGEIDRSLAGAFRDALTVIPGPRLDRAPGGRGGLAIPDPPPPPATDRGSGDHGADEWWSVPDDAAKRGLGYAAAQVADAAGWTHASAHLRHYLGNSGADLTVDPDQIARDVKDFRGDVEKTTAKQIKQVVAEVHADGTYGQPQTFNSGWQDHYIDKSDSEDWFFAMAGFSYAVTGVATVQPPAQPGGELTVAVDYQTHLFDRYNWDQGKHVQIGGMVITDQEMGDLHRAGVAKEFDMVGSGEPRRYEGPVPEPYGASDLPAPPDNRDGTRTDPNR